MPLPIRDGNQSLTTLSTLIVNSAHVPAHTVVSLGSQAITDIAQAVSGVELGPNTISALENISVTFGSGTSITVGNVVSVTGGLTNSELRASSVTIGGSVQVSNFPATQTVTFGQAVVSASNIGDILSSVGTDNTADATTKFFKIGGHQSGSNQTSHIVHVSAGGSMSVDASGSSVTFTQASVTFSSITGSVSVLNLPATQTVTFTQASVTFGTPVVTGSVSVLNFPSTQTIAGTVTIGNSVTANSPTRSWIDNFSNPQSAQFFPVAFDYSNNQLAPIPVSDGGFGVIAVQPTGINWNISGTVTANLASTNLNSVTIGVRGSVTLGAGTSQIGSVTVGNSVTIGSLPTISGTVTVGASSVTFNSNVAKRPDGSWQPLSVEAGSGYVSARVYPSDITPFLATVTVGNSVTIGSLPAISGTVTANLKSDLYDGANDWNLNRVAVHATVDGTEWKTVGTDVNSIPLPISGTVTVGNNNFNIKTVIAQDGSANFTAFNGTQFRLYTPTGASKTLNNIFGPTPSWVVAFSDSVTWFSDSGTQVGYFHDGTQWTLDDFTTPAGTLALNGSVFITNLSSESNINLLNGFTAAQLGSAYINGSGALRVSLYSSTVTASAPNGSLTTRFGTPTTANTAFATSAVTNANRKYLLIQNVTTGSNVITVGIGFTPTTTQGIQLTAGAGITFESSYIPTGAVYVLSSVTASNFTILEA